MKGCTFISDHPLTIQAPGSDLRREVVKARSRRGVFPWQGWKVLCGCGSHREMEKGEEGKFISVALLLGQNSAQHIAKDHHVWNKPTGHYYEDHGYCQILQASILLEEPLSVPLNCGSSISAESEFRCSFWCDTARKTVNFASSSTWFITQSPTEGNIFHRLFKYDP